MQPAPVRDVPDGGAFDPWRLSLLGIEQFAASHENGAEEHLRYLASLALLAPSTHNTVPLRLHIDAPERALEFALDRRAILPHSDAVGRQATISLGAALANVALAAAAYGIGVTIELHQDAEPRIRPAVDGSDPIVPVARLILDGERSDSVISSHWPSDMSGCIVKTANISGILSKIADRMPIRTFAAVGPRSP